MSKEFSSPEHAAQALAANPEDLGSRSTDQKVCFGPSNNGWFKLFWSASNIGKYDWIGLYRNAGASDEDYIGGGNWQWASSGSTYVTNTACQPGYEARYLVWDEGSGKYVSVARTGAYPEKLCSS